MLNLDFGRYLYEDLLSDINISGHNIIASVYIMSSANTKIYDKNAAKEFESIPEIIFACEQGEKAKAIYPHKCKVNESIVGSLDLRHGEKIIITAGVPFGKVGNTNILRIAKIISNSKLN